MGERNPVGHTRERHLRFFSSICGSDRIRPLQNIAECCTTYCNTQYWQRKYRFVSGNRSRTAADSGGDAERFHRSRQSIYYLWIHGSTKRNRQPGYVGAAVVPSGSIHQYAVSVLQTAAELDEGAVLGEGGWIHSALISANYAKQYRCYQRSSSDVQWFSHRCKCVHRRYEDDYDGHRYRPHCVAVSIRAALFRKGFDHWRSKGLIAQRGPWRNP